MKIQHYKTIPVSERLPENNNTVFVLIKDNGNIICRSSYYSAYTETWFRDDSHGEVIAWLEQIDLDE